MKKEMKGKPIARYDSIDALRSATVIIMLIVNNPGERSTEYPFLLHSVWNGCSLADVVFPFFIFIAGLSLATFYNNTLVNNTRFMLSCLKKGTLLIAIGLIFNIFTDILLHEEAIKYTGVLQRIGLCILLAAPCLFYLKRKHLWLLIIILLATHGYLLLHWGNLLPYTNINDVIDNHVLGIYRVIPKNLKDAPRDAYGLLSTLGALSTALSEVIAGQLLITQQIRKLYWLSAFSLFTCLILVYFFHLPINKKMWTPAFTLLNSSLAFMALVFCHHLFDNKLAGRFKFYLGRHALIIFVVSLVVYYLAYPTGYWTLAYYFILYKYLHHWLPSYVLSLMFSLLIVLVYWITALIIDGVKIRYRARGNARL